jgi:hypothetical protein
MAKLKSPAATGEKDLEEAEIEKDLKGFDPEFLELDEIGEIPVSAESSPHPFAGYPLGRKVKLVRGKGNGVSSTSLVILKDKNIFQDQSGKGVEHVFFKKDKDGNDIKATDADGRFKPAQVKSRKIINLPTSHNRVTTNPGGGRESINSVFDRKVMVDDREMMCSVIPDPIHRALVCFKLVKGKLKRDDRYILADPKQANKLMRVFRGLHYQQMKAERLSQKHYSDPSDQD